MRLTWPLTGRSEEMRLIDAALSARETSGIVVCGSAGVGKSRIVREALTTAASKGCTVRWVVATSSARALPLGAFAAWAPADAADTLQLVRGVIESLTSAPRGTAVLVGVDDVHLLDDLSTFVLHQIVQRRAAKMLFSVRDGEPIPAGIQEVWKGDRFDRLDLQPLSREETAMLVSATLGGPLHPDAARRLWTLTRGNVLYLRNIVEQEISGGRLTQRHGHWRWMGDPVVPPGLIEMIESRIGALPAAVGDVIDALAVGEPIELASLARITDPAAVEEADVRGLITLDRVNGGAQVRVAHPLYGEVRRRRTAPVRLRRLRGLVAAELAASDGGHDMRVVVRRATLSMDSDLDPDPDLFLKAARGALWLADLPLAERLAAVAIRAGAEAEASFIRAHALGWLSRGEEADAVLAEVSTTGFTDSDRARLAFLRASNMLYALADPDGAKRLIDEASQTMPPSERACIDAFLTVYWAAMGKPDLARKSSKSLVVEELPPIVGGETAMAIATASGLAGRTSDAVAAAEAGYALVTSTYDAPHMRYVNAEAHITALLLSGRIEEACEWADRLRRQAADLPGAAALLSMGLAGRAALYAGRLGTACSLLRSVVELLVAGETNHLAYRYQLPLTIALAMSGRTGDAADALAALDDGRSAAWRHVDYELALARAWVAAGQGAVSEAIKTLLTAGETARGSGQLAAEVLCLQTAAQLGERSSAPRLAELAEIVEGPRASVAARFAEALHAADGAELAAVSQEFERIGDLVAALDAAAHAAIAYRRQARRGSALGSSVRADALAEQSGASTPTLRQPTERVPLTDREREIVMLIGAGLSNRAVAERLTLSVRTVESHIYRAMAKTGATSRDELATLIPRHRARPES